MKYAVTFEEFTAAVEKAGLKAVKQSEKIFVVKPYARGSGKVELNLSSGTFYVGAGSRYLKEITSAVESAGFHVLKRPKGWSVVEAAGEGPLLERFLRLVSVVERAVLDQGKPRQVTPKSEPVSRPKSAAQIMRAAEIKAKNLATMKAVSAKLAEEKAA